MYARDISERRVQTRLDLNKAEVYCGEVRWKGVCLVAPARGRCWTRLLTVEGRAVTQASESCIFADGGAL